MLLVLRFHSLVSRFRQEFCSDYSKAKKILGWELRASFSEIAKEVIQADIPVLPVLGENSCKGVF